MPKRNNPVVASLAHRSPHPYTSIAISPNRQYAIVAGKDTLHLVAVGPNGLSVVRSLQASQHFQGGVAAPGDGRSQTGKIYGDVRDNFVRDAFGLPGGGSGAKQPSHSGHRSMTQHYANIVVTSVAWSIPQTKSSGAPASSSVDAVTAGATATNAFGDKEDHPSSILRETTIPTTENSPTEDTIVAAAGSNGVVVVWSARQAFFSEGSGSNGGSSSTSTLANQQPEATLREHAQAVNSLAWHPRIPGLLLTASQDATLKLWERRDLGPQVEHDQTPGIRSWFESLGPKRTVLDRNYSWRCRATFEPKSEAIRDIQWSKFHDDIFALVTVSGSLIVYNMYISARAIVKIAAHTGDATCLDWHPTRPHVIATGGAGDRCVKVWDLENSVNMNMGTSKRDDTNLTLNSGTQNTIKSELSANSCSSSDTSGPSSGGVASNASSIGSIGGANQPISARAFPVWNQMGTYRQKTSSAKTLHVLSISASVTKVRWRPPALDTFSLTEDDGSASVDRHDSMLAVATRGPSAGGSGVLGLWSFHRPFMPLSVVEGHEEGAVTDFAWLDTPQLIPKNTARKSPKSNISESMLAVSKNEPRRLRPGQKIPPGGASDSSEMTALRTTGQNVESILFDTNKEKEKDNENKSESSSVPIWQHALSVGRDGRCLIQSFARGDRPISAVAPSCFAMANLSPFQRGYGSLQFFSVYQRVPKGTKNQFLLTGLRQDEYTARAPGLFKEVPPEEDSDFIGDTDDSSLYAGRRLPATVPDIVFNVTDQGELDSHGRPLPRPNGVNLVTVAPEVVHLSRFAKLYKFYPEPKRFQTRVDLCLHNGNVAEKLCCSALARMWRSVASILSGSGLDELPPSNAYPANVMQFILLPTIKDLLEERADAGDVQTCVALCEVLQVIEPTTENQQTTRIPGLELNQVREWYLSYIDILQQMCLFSAASFLIRSCNDSFIGALNQQSTTIHESCPRCRKPLQPSTDSSGSTLSTTARRVCKTCRRRVGLCFLCHEPVKGMFVWCPGCGHGGHLDHALQWFGGLRGKPVREVCPTGCGHRCNLSQTLTSFPRTDSMMCFPTSGLDSGVLK